MKIELSQTADGFHLDAEQWFARTPGQLFPFFARAGNLERITPPFLRFRILSSEPEQIGEGTLIDYHLRLHGIPIRWRTRIAVWQPPARFVDEQIRGPYRLWRHEHIFEAHNGGTLARDHVHYRVPGGALTHRLFVQRNVRRIFEYRGKALGELFADARD